MTFIHLLNFFELLVTLKLIETIKKTMLAEIKYSLEEGLSFQALSSQPTTYTIRASRLDCLARERPTIGSLSTRVFETRTATGSELFSLLTFPHTTTFTLLSIFSPLEMNSLKIWETIRSKNANCSLPVAVRVSKGSLSTRVFETRTATGREQFAFLDRCAAPN